MKRWLIALVLIVALGGLIAWRLRVKGVEAALQTAQRAAKAKSLPTVTVAPAVLQDVVQTYQGIGTAEAPFNIKVASKVTGRIEFLQVREGDRVTQGQVLARINPTELESQVAQKRAALAETRSRLAQAQFNQNPAEMSVSTQIRQQDAALASAKADYNQAAQNYAAQQSAAAAAVTDAQGRISNAEAAIGSANAAIRSAQANLGNAQVKFKRNTTLFQKGFVAEQQVDDARAAVSVQEAAVDVAKQQLNSAQAQRDSARAQKQAAQEQADIVKTKGKADIEAAQAKVKQAEAALDMARSNKAQLPAYRQNLAALQSAVAAAEADLHTTEAQLSETTLTSPLSGVVTTRYLDPGAIATVGQPVLAVQTTQQVWVNVPIPEEVSRKVGVGKRAQVVFDALTGSKFTGKITQMNPSADPQSRQFTARVTLENASNQIKPGLFARVTMETERVRNAVVVPREAVQAGKKGPEVVVIGEDDRAVHREVQTGVSDTEGIAILKGVQPGEKVLVLSANPVKDGQVVKITETGK